MELCKSNWQLLTGSLSPAMLARLSNQNEKKLGGREGQREWWETVRLATRHSHHRQQCRGDSRFLLFRAKWNWFTVQWSTQWTDLAAILNTNLLARQCTVPMRAAINSARRIQCKLHRTVEKNLIWFTASPNFLAWLHFRPLPIFPACWKHRT